MTNTFVPVENFKSFKIDSIILIDAHFATTFRPWEPRSWDSYDNPTTQRTETVSCQGHSNAIQRTVVIRRRDCHERVTTATATIIL